MITYNEWVRENFRSDDSEAFRLSKYLEFYLKGEAPMEQEAFMASMLAHSFNTCLEFAILQSYSRADMLYCIPAATYIVAMSLASPFAKPDFENISNILNSNAYADMSNGPALIALIRSVAVHPLGWKILKSDLITASRRCAEFVDYQGPPITYSKPRLFKVLDICKSKYYAMWSLRKLEGY